MMPETVPFPAPAANSGLYPNSPSGSRQESSAGREPVAPSPLLARIASLVLSLTEGQKVRLLILSDDTILGGSLEACLKSLPGFEVLGSFGWSDAGRMIPRGSGIDLIVAVPPSTRGVGARCDFASEEGVSPLVLGVGGGREDFPPEMRECVVGSLPKTFALGALRKCLEEAKDAVARRREQQVVERLRPLLAAASEGPHHPGRILVKSGSRLSFVKISDIDWVEAQGDYVCLHSRQKKHLIREKISAIAQQLPPSSFARIHRSTIINLDRVKEMQPLFYGEYTVILEDGTRLTMSRSFREKVFQGLCAAS